MKLNQNGSTTLESVLMVPILGILILGSSGILYMSFAKIWLDRAAREAAVCLASPSPPTRCRVRLESTLTAGLPIGRTKILVFKSDRTGSRVSLQLAFDRSQRSGQIYANSTFRKPMYFPRGRS
ncbi:MAG: pilus assembly protein [Deltaproteobacteria bacterium]|jgi:hypothetical protein|nr:pilus assembly protein [Deltaproteobacteria bacterium]